MSDPSRKCLVWATTLGADLWTLTHYLDQRPDIDLEVVCDEPVRIRQEPIWRLQPLQAPLHAYRRGVTEAWLRATRRPEITILDNRVPWARFSPKGFVLWHGFGWKGPNDREEFAYLHGTLKRLWGSPFDPNPNFRWSCFGPWDLEHRSQVSGFHVDNCCQVGAASHDFLRTPLDRRPFQLDYPFDLQNKTVLIAPTWHYGEVFQHWGSDAECFERILGRIRHHGANAILRLHDRFRLEPHYVAFLERLARRHAVLLKFKNEHPDNLIDLQVADVLITNFSSIANLFYATGRPTLHVYPVRSADEAFLWRRRRLGRTQTESVDSVRYIWKLPPEDNGGLLARSLDQLLGQLDQALEDPRCCRDQARDFLDRHMLGADGRNCERVVDALRELAAS